MAQDPPERTPPRRPAKPPPRTERLAREAAALRANLRKRKDQARQRTPSADDAKPD